MSSCFKSVAVMARDIFRVDSNARAKAALVAELQAAERINPFPELNDYSDNGLEAVYRLMSTTRTSDGLWKCCKGHEQELIHWTGPHPFKHLRCQQCDHVLCRWCVTTEVLTPLERDPTHPNLVFSLKDQTIYGQICPGCGMSHQARPIKAKWHSLNDRIVSFKGLKCPCGLLADHTWMQFEVGSIEHYRQNPYEAWSILTTQRAEISIRSRRTSSERHAQRSSRSASASPASRADGCAWGAATPRPATSDGLVPNTLVRSHEPAPTAWSLRVHQVDRQQDFHGRRPFEEPAYVVAAGHEIQPVPAKERTRLQPIPM